MRILKLEMEGDLLASIFQIGKMEIIHKYSNLYNKNLCFDVCGLGGNLSHAFPLEYRKYEMLGLLRP